MSKVVWILLIIVVVIVSVAATYRRITPMPQLVDDMRILLIETVQERIDEITEDIAYADALLATGRTTFQLRTGIYVSIADWKAEAENKRTVLQDKLAPLIVE